MRDLIGQTLGHYLIVEQIGAGGMGVVYRARDERLDRDVAVKVLPELVASDPDRLTRFEREAKAVAHLDHPNILAIHDLGSEDGFVYAVMELLEGESLRELISRGCITTGKAVEYARAIAEGLSAAHDKAVIHRDLKPENVFVTKDSRVKILDFGLAKLRLPEAELTTETPTATLDTAPGGLIGTIPYMAPEQIQGRPADHRSDIFALGTVLYEMLTGRRPFRGSTNVETAAAILKEDPEPLATAAPGVPPSLVSVVSKCLEKRPEDRFNSAHDLALTLGAIDITTSVPPVRDRSLINKYWPHLLSVAIAATVALFVVFPPGVIFDRMTGNPETPPIRSIAILPLENLTGDPDQQYFVDGLHEELIATFAQISGFEKIIARTSVMEFRGSDTPIREIGNKLGVEAVIEGSVRRSGDTVRATIQLIDVRDESHLWANSFERNLTDILTLQRDVAEAVADEVRLKLSPDDGLRRDQTRAVNLEAYEAYLLGKHYYQFVGEEANWKAVSYYEKAIDNDSDYVPAYVGLGMAFRSLDHYSPSPELVERSRTAFESALNIDETSADAHAQLAWHLYAFEWNWSEAERELDRALELDPNNITALSNWSSLMAYLGRFDSAVDAAQRGVRVDPLNRSTHYRLGLVYSLAGRTDEAIGAYRSAVALFPQDAGLRESLATSLSTGGRHAEALNVLSQARGLRASPDDSVIHLWAGCLVNGRAGKVEGAAKYLQLMLDLRLRKNVSPVGLAQCYLANGDQEMAIEWYEKALETRDPFLRLIKVDSDLDPLRDNPRFQEIVKKMNFPEE